MKSRYIQLIIELVAWTGFLVFPLILFPTLHPFAADGSLNPALKGLLITHASLIIFYYVNFYYAIPRFYLTKRYHLYAAVSLGFLVLLVVFLLNNPAYNPLPSPPFKHPRTAFVFTVLIRFIMVSLLSLGIATIKRLQRSEKEKLRTELSYLKAQINPHFLFNTLNSIYALTVRKSESAPESVTKLSSIMRYVINEAAHDTVPLEKELAYLSAYIDLEKLRLTDKVTLDYKMEGDPRGKQIAPLVFIPLVENAFKHGVSTSEPSDITIALTTEGNTLDLRVRNTKVRRDKSDSNGLGIENTKRRLGLLYPGKHQLVITDQDKTFSVHLVIRLHA